MNNTPSPVPAEPTDAAIEELIRSLFVDRNFPSSKPGVASYWLTADELRLVMSRLATPAQQTQSDAVTGAVPDIKPVLHALWRQDGSGFVRHDGSALVHDTPIAPLEPGQLQVPLYATTPPQQATTKPEHERRGWQPK